MIFRINTSSGQPVYVQLMQQIQHATETGVLQSGDVLPSIRALAEQLVVSPNTVAKAYAELEHVGVITLRHGSGAYVSAVRRAKARTDRIRKAQDRVRTLVENLQDEGLTDDEIRRLFEAELLYSAPQERS